MLGDDIVDFSDPETIRGAQHPRFDQRVFTPDERAVLARSQDPQRTRWILWSVKESAYKAVRRVKAETVFSPIRFSVDLEHSIEHSKHHSKERVSEGRVTHDGSDYFARVETDGCFVHAIVSNTSDPWREVWGSKRIGDASPERSSREARALALDQLAARLRTDRDELRIEKRGRIPHLVHRDQRMTAMLSLSHHGGYVGFACRLPESTSAALSGVTS